MHAAPYVQAKACSVCKATKPLDDFHKDATRKDGHMCRCAACDNERYAARRACAFCESATNGDRFCDALCKEQHGWERRCAPIRITDCTGCKQPFPSLRGPGPAGFCCHECKKAHARSRYDPTKARAKRDKRMRAIGMTRTDLTPDYIRNLYAKAKGCPLCKVKLTRTLHQPDSAELDHIVPVGIGGTHTIGNVRIICRLCNQRRPKDGSDHTEQTTLWAADTTAAAAVAIAHHHHRAELRRQRDATRAAQRATRQAAAAQRNAQAKARAHTALTMRRNGTGWATIANELGYPDQGAARNYVAHYHPDEFANRPRFWAPQAPRGPREPSAATHRRCVEIQALRAQGNTWAQVATALGYSDSKSPARLLRAHTNAKA